MEASFLHHRHHLSLVKNSLSPKQDFAAYKHLIMFVTILCWSHFALKSPFHAAEALNLSQGFILNQTVQEQKHLKESMKVILSTAALSALSLHGGSSSSAKGKPSPGDRQQLSHLLVP